LSTYADIVWSSSGSVEVISSTPPWNESTVPVSMSRVQTSEFVCSNANSVHVSVFERSRRRCSRSVTSLATNTVRSAPPTVTGVTTASKIRSLAGVSSE